MIVVDIETSGLYPERHGIWQIGAVDYFAPDNIFLAESRIDDDDEISDEALKVVGKTEKELRDNSKQSQKQLLKNFFNWTVKIKNRILVAHNTPFDMGFLTLKSRKYKLEYPLKHRSLDLHSIAQTIYHKENNNTFLINEEDNEISSDMKLSKIMEMCGMQDQRIQLKDGKIIREGNPHNALEDARIEAECLRRLLKR